jgi:GGDEF domain-containing protein
VHAAYLEKSNVALLVVDLERFRNVNETLGRHAGDELLKLVAARLAEMLPDGSGPARLSGDCFAFAFPFEKETEIAHKIEERLIPFYNLDSIGKNPHPARFGIALFPTDGGRRYIINARSCIKKGEGPRDKYCFYTPQMHARISENSL